MRSILSVFRFLKDCSIWARPASRPEIDTLVARNRPSRIFSSSVIVPITVSAVTGQTLATERLDRVADYAAKISNFNALQQNTGFQTLPTDEIKTSPATRSG